MLRPSVSLAALLLSAAAPGGAPATGRAAYPADDQVAQLTLQQQVVVRMQRALPAKPAIKPIVWKEKKGPKCVSLDDLAGAMVAQPNSVDLVLKGGDRFRARFEKKCPPLDFYSGFYLKAAKDGKVCAGRDVVRSRSGGTCAVDKFRRLVVSN